MKRAIAALRLCSLGVLFVGVMFVTVSAQTQTAPQAPPPQVPPSTDIFILDVKHLNGKINIGQPVNITGREGYDNQPMFFDNGRSILYTSIRKDGQADIYRFDIASGATTRVAATTESEYSPTPMSDGRHISVIRVEADSTQRLWKLPIEGGTPSLILQTIKPVGYHAWIDDNAVAVFILGKPNTLQIVDLRTEKSEMIAENVGRSLHKVPRQDKLSFVHKASDKEWFIKSLDLKTRQVTTLIKTLDGSEDFAWTSQGVLLMASDSKLFKWGPATDKDWQQVADFSQAGIRGITRLAVSPAGDRIAIVASTTPKR